MEIITIRIRTNRDDWTDWVPNDASRRARDVLTVVFQDIIDEGIIDIVVEANEHTDAGL